MNKLYSFALNLALTATLGLPATGQTIQVGDQAPRLDDVVWLKGSPVPKLDPGKVYVVEFWATWCAPCRKGIPHLTDLARKYAGEVTIIGIDVRESHGSLGTEKSVRRFVESMGPQMDYTVGMDDPKKDTVWNAWMQAAGIRGIPCAFVIGKDGRISWIGYPNEGNSLEEALISALSGQVDFAGNRQKHLAMTRTDSKRIEAVRAEASIRDLLAAKRFAELESRAASDAADPEKKDVAEGEKYLAKLFLDPGWGKADIASRLPGEFKSSPRFFLDLVEQYAEVLPPYAVRMAIRALQAKGGEFNQRLAQIHYQLGNHRKALASHDKYVQWAKKNVPDQEYLKSLALLRTKYKGTD